MTLDRSFVELNRASTSRIRALVNRLSDEELKHPVGEDWTIASLLAHIAFWDRRVILILEKTEQNRKLFTFEIDVVVNDILLPTWAAIPAREAARMALETAEELDKRLETYPQALLEEIYRSFARWIMRNLHRNEHLDEIETSLKGSA